MPRFFFCFIVSIIFVSACGGGDLDVHPGADTDFEDAGTLEDASTRSEQAARPSRDPATSGDAGSSSDTSIVEAESVANRGWIGGACRSAADCDYDEGICLTDGYPDGQCSLACEQFCPDRDGTNSVTFCIDGGGQGRCVSQCDFELYPDSGCRPGYACRIRGRYMEPATQRAVCVPEGDENPAATTACLQALDELGIIWAPWDYETQYDGGLACTIGDPVRVSSPINSITYRYYNQSAATPMAMACELALALHRLGDVLAEQGMTDVLHIGTFNCRRIGGSDRLSQHGHGLAIDIWGFEDAEGDDYVLERDWEHGTTNPQDRKARALYDIAQAMYEQKIFNIVLTPNYNAAHDNHFHVDLTQGSNFIGSSLPPEYYIGDDRWHRCGQSVDAL